jgi:beta-mannosidase
MSKILDLNGKWTLLGTDKDGKRLELPATVPGCVHTDLIANGVISDIYYRDNSKDIQWVENCDFTYERSFFVDEIKENAYLEFDGLDTYADIFLNGKHVQSVDNMFTPYAMPVDGIIKEGENHVSVRFRSPVKEVEGRPLRPGAFTTERLNTRRIQCTYGWDWVDRFVTMGIYKDVRLCFREKNEIDNIYVFTKDINPYSAQLKLKIDLRNFEACAEAVHIEIRSPDGRIVFSKDRTIIRDSICEYIDIPEPALWYPRGYGEQPLYTLGVSTPTSKVEQKVGIRKITILQIDDKEGSRERETALWLQSLDYLKDRDFNEKTACFTLLVNGVKIMCKGGNWVPCEPFQSAETPEKIKRILALSAEMGVNMIRVWGGGIFERDDLYDECDRLGILVSQDFLMACGHYPEDEDWFIDALRREAHAAALRLRNHACLAFWTGDNENAEWGDENRTDFPGYRSATFGIEPVISRLDPERYFFPSSPYGGNRYSSATRGTTHGTNYMFPMFVYIDETDMSDYRKFFSQFIFRFNTEQPVFGMSFASCLEKYLDKEDIYGESTELLEYHSKTNPYLKHTLFELNEMMAQKIFGRFEDGADRLLKLQMIQCEWTRISLELFRRYKGFSSGIIYWMLNDCWPASAGWSFIDYYACPKPSYYAFKRCAAKALVMLSESDGVLSLHVGNDSLEALTGSASLYVYDTANGRELCRREIDFSLKPNCTESVFECDYEEFAKNMNENCVILCDALSTLGDDRAILVPKRYSDLKVGYSDWRVIYENEEKITVEADGFTPFVMIDSPYLLSDNCFILKKGERRTVKKIRRL